MRITILATLIILASFELHAEWSDDPAVNNPVALADGELMQPRTAVADDGSFYVSWFENTGSGYDVRLQRLDADGNRLWDEAGLLVADRGFTSTEDYGLDIDAEGHAVLAFRDDRFGSVDITVSRVSPIGERVWGENGVQLTDGTAAVASPRITATSAEASAGFIVAGWYQDGNAALAALDADGNIHYETQISADTGVAVASLHASDAPQESGQVIVLMATLDGFSVPRHLFAQKLDGAGQALWGSEPLAVFDDGSMQFGYFPDFVPDGSGGMVAAWYRSTPDLQVLVQHVESDGTSRFADGGLAVADTPGQSRTSPTVAHDGSDYYLFWRETDAATQSDIGLYGQRLDSAGERQWGDGGIAFRALAANREIASIQVRMHPQGAGPVASWIEADDTLKALHADTSGNRVWTPDPVVSEPGAGLARAGLVGDGLGEGFYLAWQDGRNGDSDIYAQRLDADSELGGGDPPDALFSDRFELLKPQAFLFRPASTIR